MASGSPESVFDTFAEVLTGCAAAFAAFLVEGEELGQPVPKWAREEVDRAYTAGYLTGYAAGIDRAKGQT